MIDGVTRILQVQLWDQDVTFDDFRMVHIAPLISYSIPSFIVGYANIPIKDLPDGKSVDAWYPLKPRPGKKEAVSGGNITSIVCHD